MKIAESDLYANVDDWGACASIMFDNENCIVEFYFQVLCFHFYIQIGVKR